MTPMPFSSLHCQGAMIPRTPAEDAIKTRFKPATPPAPVSSRIAIPCRTSEQTPTSSISSLPTDSPSRPASDDHNEFAPEGAPPPRLNKPKVSSRLAKSPRAGKPKKACRRVPGRRRAHNISSQQRYRNKTKAWRARVSGSSVSPDDR